MRTMTGLRDHLRKFVWIALVAMGGLAFGPTVSRALGAGAAGPISMHANCIEMDVHAHMAAAAQDKLAEHPGAPGHSSNLLDCCALCAVAASPFAAADFVVPEFFAAVIEAAVRADRARARPAPHGLWRTAAPRGPPLLS